MLLATCCCRSEEAIAAVSPRRFLEAAYSADDPSLFYTVYKFFEQRNVNLRKKPDFVQGEGCEVYVAHFKELFGTPETKA